MSELISIEHHKIHQSLEENFKDLNSRIFDLEQSLEKIKELQYQIDNLSNLTQALSAFVSTKFPEEIKDPFFSVVGWYQTKLHEDAKASQIDAAIFNLERAGYTVTKKAE